MKPVLGERPNPLVGLLPADSEVASDPCLAGAAPPVGIHVRGKATQSAPADIPDVRKESRISRLEVHLHEHSGLRFTGREIRFVLTLYADERLRPGTGNVCSFDAAARLEPPSSRLKTSTLVCHFFKPHQFGAQRLLSERGERKAIRGP